MRGTSSQNTLPSMRTGAKVSVRNTYYAVKGFQGYNKILEAVENGNGEVFLGAIRGSLSDRDHEALGAEGITANAQFVEPKELDYFEADGRIIQVSRDQIFHLSIPDETPFTELHFPEIKKGLIFIADKRKNGGKVYVNCYSGVGRSACIMILFVMQDQKLSAQKALEFIQKIRPQVHPKPKQFLAVLEYDFWDKKNIFIENRSPENSENLLTAFMHLLHKSKEELSRVFRTGDSEELENFMPTLQSLMKAAEFILKELNQKINYPNQSAEVFHGNLLGLFKIIAELSAIHSGQLEDENSEDIRTENENPEDKHTENKNSKKVAELSKMNEALRLAIKSNEYMQKVESQIVCSKLIEATQNASKRFEEYIEKRSSKKSIPTPTPSKKVALVTEWKRQLDEKLVKLESLQTKSPTLEELETIQKEIVKAVSVENSIILISGAIKIRPDTEVLAPSVLANNLSQIPVLYNSTKFNFDHLNLPATMEDDSAVEEKPDEKPTEFTIEALEDLSRRYDNSPILINDQGTISIYGEVKGKWDITPLNSELFDAKKFPAHGEKEKEIIGFNISERTRKEIKKGHRPNYSGNPLLELIRELKEAIKYLFDIGRGKRAESESCINNVEKALKKSLERNCDELQRYSCSFFSQKPALSESNAAHAEVLLQQAPSQ